MNAQQLKNSILQEAIEGRLVPQDPNDEPASVLLDRIRKEKAKLVKEGKLKKKDLEETPIAEDEKPFEIPESWEWCRLGAIATVLGGKRIPAGRKLSQENTGHVYIRVSDMKENTVSTESLQYVPKDIFPTISRYIINKEDVYITVAGTIGRIGKIPPELDGANLTENADRLVFSIIDQDWLIKCLQSAVVQKQIADVTTKVGQPKLAIIRIQNLLIPLPPLAEQRRIVAKIEELLPKVEEYGKAQEALDKLNNEFPERLKKSILQEAIQGRLVPQDPNDEPASVLLDIIRKEKVKLVKEGKLKKKDLDETPIGEDEKPFEIPESWEWVKLGELVSLFGGTSYQKNDVVKEGIRILRGGNILKNEVCLFDDDVFLPYCFSQPESNIKVGDILIVASTGSKTVIGKPAFVRKEYPNTQIGAFLRLIRPLFSCYNDYLRIIFASEYYRNHIRDEVKGIGINNVRTEYITKMVIPLPPLAEQRRIVAKIEELFGVIKK